MIEIFAPSGGETPLVETDICIIGAGAAGVTLARDLAAAGRDIVLLESGDGDFDDGIQDLMSAESVGYPYPDLRDARIRMFGGTTTIWGGRCARLNAIDFKKRSWVPWSGWPFDLDTLEPWYAKAQTALGLDPAFDGGAQTLKEIGLRPAFDPDELAVDAWTFDLAADRFTLRRVGDLQSNPRVRILLRASVTHIAACAEGNRVSHVNIANLAGGRGTVRARIFVLAAGGIEAPRILLASNDVHAEGLGNRHGWVGRCFMDHPHARGAWIRTNQPWAVLGLLSRSCRHAGNRYATLARAGEALQQREGLLNSSFTISARRAAGARMAGVQSLYRRTRSALRPARAERALWHANRRFLLAARERVGPVIAWSQNRFGKSSLFVVVRAEQSPNPESRILLSPEKDSLGVPRIKLDWQFTRLDKHSVQGTMLALDRELRRLDLGSAELSPWLSNEGPVWETDPLISNHPVSGYHHMGTARMADTPAQGVTDGHGKVHGLANLYIAGSSLFPTSGWANPTLTILALAHRQAHHLAHRR